MKEIKEIIALLVLVVCTYTDIKERQIYLLPLLLGGVAAFSISIIMCIQEPIEETMKSIFSWLIFPLLFGVFLVLLVALSKGQIGMGDGYLALVLSLCLGVTKEIRTLCVSVILSGIFCIGLIFCNKDRMWKKIPFVPFLLVGLIVVIGIRI